MYTPNNIRFRIVSSSVISQFKQDQAFDFNELINNYDVYSFSSEARETLLLNYELWFKFICRLEKMIIRTMHSNDSLEGIVPSIDALVRDVVTEMDEVVNTNPTVFGANNFPSRTIALAFKPFTDNISEVVKRCKDDTMYLAFPKIVNAISGGLHNLLCILHEIEALRTPEVSDDFLSLTDTAFEVSKNLNVCPILERAISYRDYFGIKSFYIKNYTHQEVPNDLVERLKSNGFEVTKIDTASR